MTELKRDTLSWRDGDMPFSETFGDHFYSYADGRAECGHVFMGGNGLPGRWHGAAQFTIAELGFGTGLNFLETWRVWRKTRQSGQMLHFVSFEAFPMPTDAIARAIAVWPELDALATALAARWTTLSAEPLVWAMDEQTTLTVFADEAIDGVRAWRGKADAWYLDGFAPSKNPDMWSSELMQAAAEHTAEQGTFATYTVAGWVRRNLQAAGFMVEKRAGHGAKREMMCGRLG